MILKIEKTPENHDSNQFWIYDDLDQVKANNWIGSGWMDKEVGVLRLRKCPKDGLENYPLNEAQSGGCYACGFNPNTEFQIGMNAIKNLKTSLTIVSTKK